MPTHCCVPGCTKKGYKDENSFKVSYFSFPNDKIMRKRWTRAIRREEGKNFQVTGHTKVCIRHFKKDDIQKLLGGTKRTLKPEVVPSIFDWRTSPCKQKPPTLRQFFNTNTEVRICKHINSNGNETGVPSTHEHEALNKENATQTNTMIYVDAETQTEAIADGCIKEKGCQTDEDVIEVMKIRINALEATAEKLERECESLKAKLFEIDRFRSKPSTICFYTGFSDFDVFDFLDPGENGQNIRYWSSSSTEELSNDIYDE